MSKIRIFIEEKIFLGAKIKIENNDFEYLTKVMRQKIADEIFLFNGVDGDFKGNICQIEKRFLIIEIKERISDLKKVPNITLAFAPVKNVRVDFVAAKATELGVASFQPLITKHTIVDKINFDRFKANVKEACEQCERNDFPKIFEIKKLEKFLLEKETADKILILCDESGQGKKASEILPKIFDKIHPHPTLSHQGRGKEVVILIGPEGGFSKEEFQKMRNLSNVYSLSLGPRILRADTAIISALTLVQEFLGDFNLQSNQQLV